LEQRARIVARVEKHI
jgi:hypothetical protein